MALNLAHLLTKFSDHWSQRTIGTLNDYEIKLAKLLGEFVWHAHPDTDEMFLVISGTLNIQLRDRDVIVKPGEVFVVPRGVEHNPKADEEVSALLLEPKGVVNTGDAKTDRTIAPRPMEELDSHDASRSIKPSSLGPAIQSPPDPAIDLSTTKGMTFITINTTTPVPPNYRTPHFPSLYWLIGPPAIVQPAYLYHVKDIWKFTLFWTIIIFEAAHLLVSTYAMGIVWWGTRSARMKGGMGRKTRGKSALGWGKISGMWAVPVVYGLVAGIEAVLAGSVVGLILGAVYNAGGFKMSTWIPFVWSLANLLVLVVSSFSIQGGL